jgi:hypothetical protein
MRINEIGNESDKGVPAELREVEQRLHDEKPVLTTVELDQVKSRAKESAASSSDKLSARRRELP